MSTPVLEWQEVRKSFGDREVLRGFSLSITRGQSVAILGGSGSGKSVALRHLVGLLRPDSGRVLVEGQDITEMPEEALCRVRRTVGMVFQGGALFDSLSVSENVAFALEEQVPRPTAEQRRARAEECLSLVQLAGVGDAMPASLSGGMRKRVALARALAPGPRALLYDEPTTGLDPVTAGHVNRLIRDTQRRLAVTSVIVTHDVESALFVADRIAYLKDGRLAWEGSAEQARVSPPESLRAFMRGEG